ncbi:MAG: hypothetical protein GY896_13795 [Gammaproteobacteria bacterium]|nr:hypothetical protein [Gammaproteobacteria bacterium]
MLTTLTTGMSRGLTGYLLAITIALLAVSCGGGGGGSVDGTTDTAGRVAEIVARAGPIVAVRVGETAQLSDNGSYISSSGSLSYAWSFASRPDTSNAVLQNASSTNPSFVADVRGAYTVQLVVRAGSLTSARAIQFVVATIAPERVTGPFFHQGLSSSCVNCHNDDFGTIPAKSQDHIGTSSLCETCHTPLGFDITPFVDHQEVFGNCSQCHDGVLAVGKSQFHLPTNGECDDCHNTTSFFDLNLDGSFDHTGITSGCSGCHNGNLAIGKTPTPPHPDTVVECAFCHTTDSFTGAYPDHSGPFVVGNRCDSCHGVTAVGPINGHPIPAVDCGTCHGINSFNMGGVFEHRLVDPTVQACESCHNETNSINAAAKSAAVPAHLATSTDCGSCHSTDSFSPAFSIDHTDPAVLAARCDSCHGVSASGKSVNHMPTTLDCKVCHTPGTFTTGTYDHAGVTNNCTTCHNDVIVSGKPVNHIPTTPANQDCADCHFSTTTFTGAVFSHAGIVNNCVSCHDGIITTGKSGTHIPTTQDCIVCHSTSDPFVPALNFSHAGISNNCQSCHNGNANYVAAGAIDKKLNHIPALDVCSDCHNDTNTGGFATSTFLATQHVGITNGCEGCHTSQFFPTNPALYKTASHLPTGQDCDVCHTVAGFTPTTMLAHEGITGNCASCHDGSAGFVALGARAKTPTPPHPVTSADCALCHNTIDFADAFVDHNDPAVLAVRCDSCHVANGSGTAKGMDPGHVVTTEDCGLCHAAGGSFKPAIFNHSGIVDNCASCHNGVDATGTAAKVNPSHIPISDDCSLCHTTTAFANARFEHQGITNNCGICHDGVTALGKDNDHVPTNGDCVDCHQTTGFKPATFDHAGIVNNCSSCHATGFATPKHSAHVPTNQDCGICHTPSGFVPATFDHTGIVNNCVSCHDGNTATGMDDAVPAHIPTSLDCVSCHTTTTFAGGSWTHDASSVGNCDTCHSPGGGATSKPGGHLSTTSQCDVCHTTNRWTPANFSHDSNGDYPGDHRNDPGCTGCHGNTISSTIPWPDAQYAPYCAACHENDFRRKDKHIGGKNGTVEQNKDCGRSGCHRVSDKDWD